VRSDFEKSPPIALAPFGASEEARKYTAKQIRPVHALIKKNQNGRTGRIPLVLFPNYFLFMLGDYMAEPRYETSADGQRKKGAPYYGEQFVRVLPDWREDPMEAALGKAGGLVTEYRDGE
jgi:hypothetical protein